MKLHKFMAVVLAAISLVACKNVPTTDKAEEINDATTPLHLLKPEYKVPYGELKAEDVKASLDRIYDYIEAERPTGFVDKDGKLTGIDSSNPTSKLPEGSTLQRGAFRIGSYEWGITYQAMLDAAKATGDERYSAYVDNVMSLLTLAYPLFRQRDGEKADIEDAQMKQIIYPAALDDCGTMCTAMMKYAKTNPDARNAQPPVVNLDTLIDNYFNFVEYGQMRLSTGPDDNLFARNRPQHNTIWLDDMYMGIPTLAYRGVYTGDKKYLDVAKRFSHKRLLLPLEQRQDCLDNMHANTQVPKVVGFERISELSGDEAYHNAASFFWDIVTGERTLAFGGNSRREHFPSKEACKDFVEDIDGPETCNTNNMLKLSEELHRRHPEARYADFYELATFNHILSSQHPEHGGYVYFTSARPRHYRNYSAPNEAMWCCVGTGMENHGKYGQFVYTKIQDNLFVNLFAATQLNWKERGIVVRQETQFPYAETSRISIAEGKGQFTLQVRYPAWVKPGEFALKVNGQPVSIVTGPSSYVAISRKWKKGDVVDITFPMHNSVKYLPNLPQYIALMHGPIMLAMKTGTEDLVRLIADDSRFGQLAVGKKLPVDQAPILINNNLEDIANQLHPIAGKPLHFTLTTRMENEIRNELMPFFELHDSRYMMYWLALSENSYKGYLDNLAKREQERQALEDRTVDKVQPGEQQPESDHFMETDRSNVGNTNDVFYRDASDGHYFSYLLQTGGQTELSLRLKYWGVGEWKSHEFDILVDDVVVTSVNNTGKYRISEFKYETYPIPAELLKGKKQVRVKFQAKPRKQIGEIYEVRLVKN